MTCFGFTGHRVMLRTLNARGLRRRRRARGFTLMELMVVVLLVALLAMLAAPSMSEARNDRAAFDYARQYQQVIQRARSRAAGTGASHLALLGPGTGGRGFVRIYAALDGEPKLPLNQIGPNPVSSCKQIGQWTDAATDPIVLTSTTAKFIDFADINRGGINADMGLKAELFGTGLNLSGTLPVDGFIALCVTPSGVTYAGGGATATLAITNMRTATPFTGTAEVEIQRHSGATGIGIKRRVIITGGGAPRVRSEG
jgi:prepilin-type N-terminal cleavage/methylation domain-containing protein